MKRSVWKKAGIFLSALLAAALLLAGCRQAGPQKDPVASSSASPSSVETSSSGSASRLPELLDGKKYENQFAIWFFNIQKEDGSGKVNAGDMTLLRSPDGKTMLIDTGYKETISEMLDDVKKIGVTNLDYLVATHMHSDHVGGVPEVLDSMPVGKIVTSRFACRNIGTAKGFAAALEARSIKPDIVKEGDSFSFGKDIRVEVLSPVNGTYEIPDDSFSNQDTINENSVVLKMTYGKNTFLFTGDIQRETEMRLVEKYGKDLHADLVKVPHHGYNTSSSRLFVNTVSPKIAVVPQCIMPNLDVYQRYQTAKSKVYVTGLDGVVLALSDGKNVSILTEKDRTGGLKP